MTIPTNHKSLRTLGAALFVVGVLLNTLLAAISIIADYEAVFYGFEKLGAKNLSTLACPVLLTPNAPGHVRAMIQNPNQKPIELTMRVSFSSPGPFVYEKYREPFEAGETRELSWAVTEENVNLGIFVFAHVGHFANTNIPFRNGNCGMTMINVPLLNGDQLFLLWYTIGITSLLGGLGLWYTYSKPIEGQQRLYYQYMRFLSILVLITLLIALLNNWVIGIALLAIVLLALVSMLMLPSMNT